MLHSRDVEVHDFRFRKSSNASRFAKFNRRGATSNRYAQPFEHETLQRTSVKTLPFSSSMSLNTPPLLNSREPRKLQKNSTLMLSRNGAVVKHAVTQRMRRHLTCGLCANCGATL
jgi:hypothetical protein